jgi:hypothetical protein
MEPEIQIESAHEDEDYLAPDVVRLGTAESLTAGTQAITQLGDSFSTIN